MSRLKITKGKNFTVISNNLGNLEYNWYDIIGNPRNGWGKWVADAKSASIIDGTIEEAKANAELIADAFNTANETDKLPSEIKQGRDAALRLLGDFCNHLQSIDYETVVVLTEKEEFTIRQAKELINKIENND